MKTILNPKILPAGFGLLWVLPVLAIEPPKDDAPPPPSVKTPASTPALNREENPRPGFDAPADKASAYIGLVTADIPEILAAHIGVKTGEGVVIREVAPDSPAAKAGFAKHDVITRVAGKSIGSPKEVSDVIVANHPGDEIAIDFVHEGKPASRMVKLEARPDRAQAAVQEPRERRRLDLDNLSDDQAQRIQDLIDQRLRRMREQQRELEKEFDLGAQPPRGGGLKGFQFKSDATFRLMDENGSIEMKSTDGSKEITVRDRSNNVTWSGPWDTAQDKQAAPEEIRQRIEKFKIEDNFRGNGFRLRMGNGFPGDDE
jgi:serine protease Do